MATLAEIKEWTPFLLSDMAECFAPDRTDSPGGTFLTDVRDAVVEAIEDGTFDPDSDRDDNDHAHPIADNAPDCMTYNRWQEFLDLGAWEEEPDIEGEWPNDLTRAAGVALYQIAERLALAIVSDWRAGLEDSDDEDDSSDWSTSEELGDRVIVA